MSKPPQISESEWEVMNALWEHSPRTAAEVVDAVAERMQWHPKTVKTLLGRLVRKGAIRFREEGNHYLYRAAFPREQMVLQESRSFLRRVFGGSASPMLVHFVREAELTGEEIEQLKRILDEKRGEER
jgi:BlaI family transcriptional regulator, penicillinase repressor